jgi:hypothetical protein
MNILPSPTARVDRATIGRRDRAGGFPFEQAREQFAIVHFGGGATVGAQVETPAPTMTKFASV